MFLEIFILVSIICFLNYIKVYIDTILTVYFLNFLRKVIQLLVKVRSSI